MKSLNHPNLVKMLGVCIEKSPFYLVQVSMLGWLNTDQWSCSDDDDADDNDYDGDDVVDNDYGDDDVDDNDYDGDDFDDNDYDDDDFDDFVPGAVQ